MNIFKSLYNRGRLAYDLHKMELEDNAVRQVEDRIASRPLQRGMSKRSGWALPLPYSLMLTEDGFRVGVAQYMYGNPYAKNYTDIASRIDTDKDHREVTDEIRRLLADHLICDEGLPLVWSGTPD